LGNAEGVTGDHRKTIKDWRKDRLYLGLVAIYRAEAKAGNKDPKIIDALNELAKIMREK